MRSPKARVSLLLVLFLWFPQMAASQVVQGQLLSRADQEPVEGALVLLFSVDGDEVGGYLTNAAGRFRLRAQGPGRFFLRAERIGYETSESDTLSLSRGQTLNISLETSFAPIALEELRVEGEHRCVVRPEEGVMLSNLWEEARKALTVQEWTDREGLYRFQMETWDRELDVLGIELGTPNRQVTTVVQRSPIRTELTPEELMAIGFIQAGEAGPHHYIYHGPDAAVLLSDEFLDTHCFRLALDDEKPGMVGLSFEPVRKKQTPDILGTLWLDLHSARLDFLEYGYDWAPWPEARGAAKGRIEFESLPSGAWIVRRYWIRMPRMGIDSSHPPDAVASGIKLLGLKEDGGEITRITRIHETGTHPPPAGVLVGEVWDTLRAAPMAGAVISLSGTSHRTSADAQGRFVMEGLPEGVFTTFFTHPRLDSAGVTLPGIDVELAPFETTTLQLGAPSKLGMLRAVCGQGDMETALTGTVRQGEGGPPMAGVRLGAEFEVLRRVPDGWRSSMRVDSVVTDYRGRYRFCGLPADSDLHVQASFPGFVSPKTRLGLSMSETRSMDLVLFPDSIALGQASAPLDPILPEMQAPDPGPSEPGTVMGRVLDSSTGVPVGKVEVWLISEGSDSILTVVADGGGRFRFPPVPPGDYSMRAVFRDFGEASASIRIEPGSTKGKDLSLVFSDSSRRTGSVGGRVVTAGSGEPITGARVELANGDRVQASGEDGSFQFTEVPIGATNIQVSLLGHAPAEGAVMVGGGLTVKIEVRLSPQPIELDPIVVEATRLEINATLVDVRRRAARGFGTVLMSDELDKRMSVTRTTDLLQEYGATVVGATESQRALYFRRTMCGPMVYIDGIRVTHGSRSKAPGGFGGEVESARAVNMVHPMDMEAMEIYRGPAQVPGEFLDSNAQCGVILIWTKRGGE